jgi:hypothetical protein
MRTETLESALTVVGLPLRLPKTYIAEYERYAPSGEIEISIGVTTPQ